VLYGWRADGSMSQIWDHMLRICCIACLSARPMTTSYPYLSLCFVLLMGWRGWTLGQDYSLFPVVVTIKNN
jgi:hypothetical protein